MRIGFLCLLLSLPLTFAASAQSSQGGNPNPGGGGNACPEFILPGQPPCAPFNGGSSGNNPPPSSPDGIVHGGQQPVVGAHIYLYKANTTSYGDASISLLNSNVQSNGSSNGGQDASGNYYVISDSNGFFTLTGNYTCAQGDQVYAYAVGGDSGSGTTNSAIGELAILGTCPGGNFSGTIPYVYMSEVTTVAAAYAMAGFATDALHVSSDSGNPNNPTQSLAATGIANAFANFFNLADLNTGTAWTTTPAGNGTVPQSTLYTLADIIAACVNSPAPTSNECSVLLPTATSNGIPIGSPGAGTAPTDTATAAINIAHYPGSNVATLFYLIAPQSPYTPLSTPPNDFSVGINFSGSGIFCPYQIAIDAMGDAWVTNPYGVNCGAGNNGSNSISELSSLGAVLSGTSGYNATSLVTPEGIAIDATGNAWVASFGNDNITEFSGLGQPLSPIQGDAYGYLNGPKGISIDSSGNVWIADYGNNNIVELDSYGQIISPLYGYTGGGLYAPNLVAVDGTSHVWVPNNALNATALVSEFSTSGNPISNTGYTVYPGNAGLFGIAMDNGGNAWISAQTCSTSFGCVVKLSPSGSPLSGTNGYTGGGMSTPVGIAIDGLGNAWVSDNTTNGVTELSNTGTALSPSSGYTGAVPSPASSIVVDGSGDVWMTIFSYAYPSVTEMIGIAAPVVTPLASGATNNRLGTRP